MSRNPATDQKTTPPSRDPARWRRPAPPWDGYRSRSTPTSTPRPPLLRRRWDGRSVPSVQPAKWAVERT